jgi:pimeloyl-ACP methyl ester carboxylesterase
MKTRTKQVLALGAVVGGVALASRAANRAVADRIRGVVDDDLDPLYQLPPDVIHHRVPTHDGGTVHVIERGAGRPLVLLHGVTLQAEVWAPLLHLLADRFRVLALDVRGHGESVVGDDGVGRVGAARDLIGVLEHLDLRGAVLAGHSMGGMIIGEACTRHPREVADRVAGLVFMNTASAALVPRASLPAIRTVRQRANARVSAGKPLPRLVGANNRSLIATRAAFGSHPSGAAVEQARRLGESVDLRYYIPLWADLLDYDGEEGLEAFDGPSLVLVGSQDRLTPAAMARRLAAHLGHAELHVIPGAGHQLLQERPRQVSDLIRGLADRLDDGSDRPSASSRNGSVADASDR